MKIPLVAIFLLVTLSVIAVVNSAALKFSLFFSYPWLDIPLHFLGGASIAFAMFTLPHFLVVLPERYYSLVPVISVVLIIGLLWELFEIYIGIPLLEDGFGIDLLGDLTMDVLGGMVGFYIARALTHMEKRV